MARIPLRSYNREIETLIDHGQIEEAIAHAKNIIRQHPKHIETYRLLGKAYLESQRYSEASDILQRVLSVIPDDFISQLGMSIIREDEGNLDAAIWHMERAFEVQPFNRAVQDELRRLYGRRDGLEPPRVRLNRGSLVRMYTRGELYPQAIAEIRAALAEDPQRLDLQVLLARVYHLTGQKMEAAEIASTLLGKIPYCLEANRILMEILPGTSRAEEARAFQRRVFELDPYAEFISPSTPSSDLVSEQSVMVERIDWQPSMEDTQSPEWVRTIGAQWEQPQEEDLPDWLNLVSEVPAASTQVELTGDYETGEPVAVDELIPDFMRDAGWSPSAQPEEEAQGTALDEDIDQELEDQPLPAADIPDWLQSMSPENPEQTEATAGEMGWLEEILPQDDAVSQIPTPDDTRAGDEGSGIDWLAELPQDLAEEEDQGNLANLLEVPALVEEIPTETADETVETLTAPEGDELPDWLATVVSPVGDVSTPKEPVQAETLPDWLAETSQVEQAPAAELAENEFIVESEPAVESWLAPNAAESQVAAVSEFEDVTPERYVEPVLDTSVIGSGEDLEVESPELVSSAADTSEADAPKVDTQAAETDELAAALAWLEGLAVKQGADEESLKISAPEERSETPPDWVAEFTTQPAEPSLEEETPMVSAVENEPLSAKSEIETTPDWLKTLDEVRSQDVRPAAHEGETDLSEWKPEEAQADIVSPEPGAWIAEKNVEIPSSDIEGEEYEPSAQIEETSEPLPEWIAGLATEEEKASSVEDTQPVKTRMPEVEQPIVESPQVVPDWLAGLEDEAPEQTSEEISAPVAGLEPESITPLEPLQPEVSEWQPEVLEYGTGAVETPILEEPLTKPSSEDASPESAAAANEMDAAMAWLESLAARQGAEEESLKITAPEERSDAAPAWIADLLQEEKAVETPSVSETLPEVPAAEVPVLIEEIEVEQNQTETLQPPTEEETEIPSWLLNYEEEQQRSAQAWQPLAETQPVETQEDINQWLQQQTAVNPPLEETPQPVAQLPVEQVPAQAWMPEETTPAPLGSTLAEAQSLMDKGELTDAVEHYTALIQSGENLDETIHDLHEALYRYPVDVSIWQALGDAYMRADKIQEALDAYTKAEELLR